MSVYFPSLSPIQEQRVLDEIGGSFVISAEKVQTIMQEVGLSEEALLRGLVPLAKKRALAPVSRFHVGAAGLGESGAVYMGVNVEFQGLPLSHTIHAEQFLFILARNWKEKKIVKLAVSAAPCGYCRQFMNETGHDFTVLLPESATHSFSSLLPHAFGPKDLGLPGGLLSEGVPQKREIDRKTTKATSLIVVGTQYQEVSTGLDDGLLNRDGIDPGRMIPVAHEAAMTSYAPYTKCLSGVAVLARGKLFSGSYLENAAYNPTVPALYGAFVSLIAENIPLGEIQAVSHVLEREDQREHAQTIKKMLKCVGKEKILITQTELAPLE